MPYHNIFSGIIKNVNSESNSFGYIDRNGSLGFKNNIFFDVDKAPCFEGNRASLDILSFDISDKLSLNQENLIFLIKQKNKSDILDIYLVSLQIYMES